MTHGRFLPCSKPYQRRQLWRRSQQYTCRTSTACAPKTRQTHCCPTHCPSDCEPTLMAVASRREWPMLHGEISQWLRRGHRIMQTTTCSTTPTCSVSTDKVSCAASPSQRCNLQARAVTRKPRTKSQPFMTQLSSGGPVLTCSGSIRTLTSSGHLMRHSGGGQPNSMWQPSFGEARVAC